jgi:membrane protein DedA with SNARE-associated domain
MGAMVSRLLHPLLDQHGFVVYLIVGLLVFAEAAILFGFIFPGETAVLIGGVIASRHHVSLVTLIVVVVACAIVGDSVGYWVGKKFGSRLLGARLLVKRRRAVDFTRRFLHQRGAWAVFFARFTAFLRAMVPGLAGVSEMSYRTFFPANALGGVVWGVAFSLLGFAVGGAYTKVEKYSSWASYVLLAIIVAAFVFFAVRARYRERRLLGEGTSATAGEGAADDGGDLGAGADDAGEADGGRDSDAEAVAPAE